MDLHLPFIRSIAESVYDDTPRLIYADYLEDHGQPERAEFIRVQCELEPMRDRYEIGRAAELHGREEELLQKHKIEWLGPEMAGWDRWREDGASAEFRRGFVDTVAMPVRTFFTQGAEARRLHPTIRRVVLFRVNGYGEQLAACEALDRLAELELACWYSDTDAEAIASSKYLRQLQVLEIWLGRREGLTDRQLCRTLAASKAWPGLRELTLFDPDPETGHLGKRLPAVANKIVGRKLAVYRWGYPEVYPFAADFWYTFPGYLPDGRMAMADEDATTSPPSLCVLTFDKKGKQMEEVLTVPFPDDLVAVPPGQWYEHKDRLQQHLIEAIGFRPGFIRVHDCIFPKDESMYMRPSWDTDCEVGLLDLDDEASWQESPCGYGGHVTYLVRTQQFVFGWDRYGDKQGRIHST